MKQNYFVKHFLIKLSKLKEKMYIWKNIKGTLWKEKDITQPVVIYANMIDSKKCPLLINHSKVRHYKNIINLPVKYH